MQQLPNPYYDIFSPRDPNLLRHRAHQCKLLNLVPRHSKIVAEILGVVNPRPLTVLIGFGEILMAIWILNGWRYRLSAWLQVFLVASSKRPPWNLAGM